jgi:putative acetyltransferase
MIILRERPEHVEAIRTVTAAAFARPETTGPTMEATLVDELRASQEWLPHLSLVALDGDEVVGHVVCSRALIGAEPVLGLGPLSVRPDRQRQGVGSALMHAVLGAADALDETVVVLLGHLDYYPRFGFRPARELGITPPRPEWQDHFQARPLSSYVDTVRGAFSYAEPFDRT